MLRPQIISNNSTLWVAVFVAAIGCMALPSVASRDTITHDQKTRTEAPWITEFTPCDIGTPPNTLAAECATLEVSFTHDLQPPNPDATTPETLTLSIARLSSRNKASAADPTTVIAGGPGQSAQDSWPQLAAAFHPILADRDVYLIDQRGTGKSSALRCPPAPSGSGFSTDLNDVEKAAIACYDAQNVPTQWFTTSVAVRDLDAVRKALGVEQWNLYGVSYGTRVALHYLRRFPEHTRALILDAVVPPQKPLGAELPLHAQQSLDALFTRCEARPGCTKAFPGLSKKVSELFTSLKESPRTVQFENLSRGAVESMPFTDQHLATSVRLLAYSSYGNAILPSMLYDAAVNGNLAPFARHVAIQERQLSSSMATGMHAAVICTEDVPELASLANRDSMKETYLGDFILDAMPVSCLPWPRGVMDADFHAPLASDVPVLALSGSVDPITPPEYAELAISELTNSRHLVNEHQAHVQAPLGCVPKIMSQFIATKDPDSLSVDCLDRLTPPALFIDANGPLP